MQYVAFASFLGMLLLIHNILKTFTLMNNIQYSPLFNGAICNGHAFPPNILDDVLLSSTFWIFHWSYLLTGGLWTCVRHASDFFQPLNQWLQHSCNGFGQIYFRMENWYFHWYISYILARIQVIKLICMVMELSVTLMVVFLYVCILQTC